MTFITKISVGVTRRCCCVIIPHHADLLDRGKTTEKLVKISKEVWSNKCDICAKPFRIVRLCHLKIIIKKQMNPQQNNFARLTCTKSTRDPQLPKSCPNPICLLIHSPAHSSAQPPIHLSIHTYTHPPTHSFIHPPTHPHTHPSTYSSIHPSIHTSIHPSIHLSIKLYIFVVMQAMCTCTYSYMYE